MNTLFNVEEYTLIPEDFTSDDWETPPEIAQKMAALVSPNETVLEAAAGRGAIVRYLPKRTTAYELKQGRVKDGKILAPHAEWHCQNFLAAEPEPHFDVVITNPPFSVAIDFIEHSVRFLNPNNPYARLLYLLPGDYFASQERCDRFEALDCCINHRYRIRGRVAFIKEGVRQDQRQVYDCIYSIVPGKARAVETVL